MTREEQDDLTIEKVISNYSLGYLHTALAILFAINCITVYNWKLVLPDISAMLSAFLYSGGSLSFIPDLSSMSWGGKRPSEILAKRLFIISYVLGTIFATIAASK